MPPKKKPSQAGKFKPRKTAAKRPGSSSVTPGSSLNQGGGDARPDTAASSAAAARSSSRGSGRDKQPRGRKKHMPIPSGQVFFTGGTADDADGKKRRGTSAGGGKGGGGKGSGSTGKKGSKGLVMPADSKLEQNEVIVGELAEAIGQKAGGQTTKSVLGRESRQSDYIDENDNKGDASGSKLSFSLTEYDSDTSDEEANSRRARQTSTMQPTQLPFPTPAGAEDLYPMSLEEDKKSDDRFDMISIASVLEDHEKSKDWFLLQLPTRLPIAVAEENETQPQTEPEAVVSSTNVAPVDDVGGDHVLVSTPAVQPNSFDQTLTGDGGSSGLLGKMRIYESGRSTLVINGVEFELDRGLPRGGMAQHAVVIDTQEADYILLGSVRNTIVATPKVL